MLSTHVALMAICVLLLTTAGRAQTLQHRLPAEPVASSPSMPVPAADARQALPLEAEGEYRWGEPGEVISLYVENGALHGYLTRRSTRTDAASPPMTFRFDQARTTGSTIRFTTRHIQGDWYSFTGSVVQVGSQKNRLPKEYLLQGMLTTYLTAKEANTGTNGEQALITQTRLLRAASTPP